MINLSKDDEEAGAEEATTEEAIEEAPAEEGTEEYIALEQRVKELSGEGVPIETVIRQVVEENFEVNIGWLEKITGVDKFKIGRVKGQLSPARMKKSGERLSTSKILTRRETQEKQTRREIYKTDTDTNSILKQILSTHPDITPAHIAEVMSWASMTPGGMHPAHLQSLLASLKGIDLKSASMIAQKYQLALSKAAQDAAQNQQPFMYPGTGAMQPATLPGMLPSYAQMPGSQPFPQQPSGYFTKDQVEELIDKALDKERAAKKMEDLESTVAGLRDEIPRLIKENLPSTQVGGEFEEETIYLNGENKSVPKEQATHYKVIRRPISTRQSADFRALENRLDTLQQTIQDKKVEALSSEIKELREQKAQPATEDPKLIELKQVLMDTKKDLKETQDKISADEKRRLEDKIGNLDKEISNLRTSLSSSGVNSPEGVIAQGITTFGNRKPAEKALEVIERIITPGAVAAPVPQEGAVQTGEGVLIQEARKKGLVTVIRERVKGG